MGVAVGAGVGVWGTGATAGVGVGAAVGVGAGAWGTGAAAGVGAGAVACAGAGAAVVPLSSSSLPHATSANTSTRPATIENINLRFTIRNVLYLKRANPSLHSDPQNRWRAILSRHFNSACRWSMSSLVGARTQSSRRSTDGHRPWYLPRLKVSLMRSATPQMKLTISLWVIIPSH